MPHDDLYSRRKRGMPSKAKAKEILSHGEVKGHPLTEKARGYMGMVASGKTPMQAHRMSSRGRRKRRGKY